MTGRRPHAIVLLLALFAVWLLWSGHLEPLLVGFGAASSVLVVLMMARLRTIDSETVPLSLAKGAPAFLPWLTWQIMKSNWDVARRILMPHIPISPRIVRVRAGQRTELGRSIYANSITLTPGTVAIDLEGDEITVHALTAESAADLATGEMDARVSRYEGRH
jgi:multicomponent Na+:H+ antiporter subunit E